MAIFDGTTLQCVAEPSYSASVSETPDLRVTSFGDGYQQTVSYTHMTLPTTPYV